MPTPPAAPKTPPKTIYAVSELAELIRTVLDDALPRVWVQGELSNFSRPASGHWYFTLKDARAQLRCAMFKNANLHVRPAPKDGDAVLVRAKLDFYTARGELQLIVEHLEAAGEGALLRAFEELKRRLASEGLFDEHLKRELPARPRGIGLITSGTGAALHDMLTTLSRRYPIAPVYLYPVPVQGSEAPPAIVRALQQLPQRAPVDVILLARGGGSLEDLWAFNDERVARAIRACAVPVVSGVGHEVDVTIADFAADLRAPTPTGAAERATPDVNEWLLSLGRDEQRLAHALERRLQTLARRSDELQHRLHAQHPGRRLQERGSRLADTRERLVRAIGGALQTRDRQLAHAENRLLAHSPMRRLTLDRHRLDFMQQQLREALRRRVAAEQQRLVGFEATLKTLNPRAVLDRGYAIALDAEGRALTDAAQTAPGATVALQLAHGSVDAIVERVTPGPVPRDRDT